MSLLIALEGISRVYSRADGEVRALEGISLAIDRGDFVCLTGPSGSGKSTLLHILGLLDTPTSGRYRLGGADVSRLEESDRARRRNCDIGFVFQAFHLVPHLTITENVELPLMYRGVELERRRERAVGALTRVGLAGRRGHRPDELSGGEQQRAAVARALVTEPMLLLADEPTGNLDESSARGVLELFENAHGDGTTVIVVTHNPRVAAVARRGYEIHGGRLS